MRFNLINYININSILNFYYKLKNYFDFFIFYLLFIFVFNFYYFDLFVNIDKNQGYSYLIIFIHLPVAWFMFFYFGICFVFNVLYYFFRYKLLKILVEKSLLISIFFTLFTIITGMFWGKCSWGTYWVWDSRLTSTFIFFILLILTYFLVYLNSYNFSLILNLLNFLNIPLIKYSVLWWNTLHQGPSIGLNFSMIHIYFFIPVLFSLVFFFFISFYFLIILIKLNIIKLKLN